LERLANAHQEEEEGEREEPTRGNDKKRRGDEIGAGFLLDGEEDEEER
jgi:hypothetical protein